MWRSRPVVVAATFTVLAGAFSVTVPFNPLADWLGLLALAGAVGYEIGAALATRRVLCPPGNASEMERLRLLHGRTHISCFAGEGAKSGLQVGGGVIGYQVRWGVAVAVGDPLTAPRPPQDGGRPPSSTSATGRRWVPCFFQTDAGAPPVLSRCRLPAAQVRRGGGGGDQRSSTWPHRRGPTPVTSSPGRGGRAWRRSRCGTRRRRASLWRRAGGGVAGLAPGAGRAGDGLLPGTPPRRRGQHHPLHGGPRPERAGARLLLLGPDGR